MKTLPTFATKSKARGFAIFEVMAVMTMSTVLAAGVWSIFGPANTSASVAQESQRLNQLQYAVRGAYISNVDFAGISTARSINEKWAPQGIDPSTNAWTGVFGLMPATVNVSNDSWQAIEQSVPNAACEKLVSQEASSWTDIQVDGQSVTPATALATCGVDLEGGHTMAFIKFGGVRHGTSLVQPCYNTNPPGEPASACQS
jgi:hypothetical protein